MSLRRLSVLVMLLGLLPWVAGCTSEENYTEYEAAPPQTDEHDDHHHDEHGPHEGHLVDLGDHSYLAEVVFDAATHTLGVYLLDHDEMKPLPIEQKEIFAHLHFGDKEEEFTLTAKPQEGDGEGKSSYFELVGNETIKEHVTDAEDLEGEIIASIGEKTFEGEIEHHHDHDHDHGHDHDEDHKDEK
ncbi:MAG: hypothetical protein KDA65_15005 [Planctomycetaceae bacterium]|nr:hypothetical protein [Planctomycetaceae bacterium]